MDNADKKLLDDINTHGWHVLKVFDEAGQLPDFAYSIGHIIPSNNLRSSCLDST